MSKSKKNRRFTEGEIVQFRDGDTFLVELNMPTSKYHGSIFRTRITNGGYAIRWFILDAPELPRRLNVHFTKVLRTTETKIRLTNTPTVEKKDIEFVDFSGYKFKIGDVLFGEGKLIKVTNLKPTICVAKILHPAPGKWQQDTYRYRATSMKKFLYIEDPTLVLLKT